MGPEEENERGRRAIRASWRMEMHPGEIATAALVLAGLPRGGEPQSPALQLAAAGRELLSLRQFASETGRLAFEGEIPFGSKREVTLLDEVIRGVAELVARVEAHLGTFAAAGTPSRRDSGVRETFLLDLAPDHRKAARSIVDLAHQAGDAPPPTEPVGRMMLRAIAEDLREVERFLVGAAGEMEDELRHLTVEIHTGCGELAGAIEELLPPAPPTPADSGLDEGGAGTEAEP